MSRDEFVWVEKYRPKTIDECILPTNIKKTFQDFLDKGEVPNLLYFWSLLDVRKTTVANMLCNQLGVDVYVINGSDEGRFLDTVRNNAKNFDFDRQLSFVNLLNTKSSSLTKVITRPQMYNSLLRSFY